MRYGSDCNVRPSDAQKNRYFTRKPDLRVNCFKVRESCTGISDTSLTGIALIQ